MYSNSSVMHKRAVTHLIALATVLFHSAGELVIAPQNTVSKVGDTTYFNCSTNLSSSDINWRHGSKYIYSGDFIIEPYDVRFEIDRNASDGSYNLVIHSVEPGDAGEYICIEVKAQATRRSARLIVLDVDPVCQSNMQPDGVIGQNAFNIPQDELQLTCAVTYHGSIPPQMVWKMVGENSAIELNAISDFRPNNHLMYILKLKGDISLHNSSYVCQINSSTQTEYQCISETIRVLYFVGGVATQQNVVRGDEITCIASNSTFPCTSQWYHDNYTCPLSCDETITAHLLGEYVCKVKCHVRENDYFFDTLKVVVVEPTTYASKSGVMVAAAATPIIIVIILALSITISAVVYKRKKTLAIEKINREIEKNNREAAEKTNDLENRKEEDEQKFEKERQRARRSLNRNDRQPASARWLEEYSETAGMGAISTVASIPYATGDIGLLNEEVIKLRYKIRKEDNTDEDTISGVALLDGKLFIVCKETSTLQVYNFNNVSPKLLNIPNLVDAVDICSYKEKKWLFIMDKKNGLSPKEVLKIDSEGKEICAWLTKDNAGGYLSTTEHGNVIIAVKYRHILQEYLHDGKHVHDIELREQISPWHAIKIDDTSYLVSHGTIFDTFHKVSQVDKEGKISASFGHKSGSAENQLDTPNYLAVRSNGDVVVADHGNNRLLLLDSELNFKANIASQGDLEFEFPQKVCVDGSTLVVVVTASDPIEEEGSPGEGTEGDHLINKDKFERNPGKWKLEEVSVKQQTTRDCMLLVVEIQPLPHE